MPVSLPNTFTNGTPADALQVNANFNAVNAAVFMPVVSSLPGSPVDGQDCFYLADATNGVVWHLKYRSASSSAYKWEVVGGDPLTAEVATGDLTNVTTYGDLPSVGPSITVPLAGDYILTGGALLNSTTAAFNGVAAVKLGSAATADTEAVAQVLTTAANGGALSSRTIRRTLTSAGAVAKMQYRSVNATSLQFSARVLSAMPARVG